VFFTAGASLYPRTWDVTSIFGEVHGAASVYLTAELPAEPTVALRAGGKKVWGTYPFHEAAYVGGGRTLRGFRSQRFAGDAVAFGNAELRITASRFKILVPGVAGLFGLLDVGRVFHEADPSDADTWHTGVGGGIWLSVIDRLQTLTAGIATGEDLTGLYIRAGFLY
jgi:outer membrane protein assembly factor BamA